MGHKTRVTETCSVSRCVTNEPPSAEIAAFGVLSDAAIDELADLLLAKTMKGEPPVGTIYIEIYRV